MSARSGIEKKMAGFKEYINEKLENPDSQRKLVLTVVCIALLLDNMLYMVIVPIIPDYLQGMGVWNSDLIDHVTTAYPKALEIHHQRFAGNHDLLSHTKRPINAGNVTLIHKIEVHTGNSTKFKFFYNRAGDPTEDKALGYLFASKAIFQLLFNAISGAIIDRHGYDKPMMFGLSIMFISTTLFAFGESYEALFVARSLQGVGSAFADTAGLAMVADRFTEEGARNKALGIALAFISFGCLVAPPFGGILYQLAGKYVPFLSLATLALIDGCLVIVVMKPARSERKRKIDSDPDLKPTPMWRLLLDPYIVVCAGCLMMANVSLAFLEPTISVWMKERMNAQEWQMGLIWFPPFFPHVAGVYTTVRLARAFPRHQWLLGMIGLAMEGLSCLIIPLARSFWVLVIPLSILCFGIAMVDTSLLPTLAYLVDTRHVPIYGSVFAIADISYSLAYAFGPIVAGQIVASIGFVWLNIAIFVSNIAYCPLMFALWRIFKYKPLEGPNEESAIAEDRARYEAANLIIENSSASTPPVNGSVQGQDRWKGVTGISSEEYKKNPYYASDSDGEYGY